MPDEIESEVENSFEQEVARLRSVTEWILLIGPLLFGGTALTVGISCGLPVPVAIGLFFLLQTSALWSLRNTLLWREKAFAAIREDPASEIAPVPATSRALPYLAGLLAIALSTYSAWSSALPDFLGTWPALGAPDSDAAEARLYAGGFIATTILSALFAQYFATVSREVSPEAEGAAAWFRAGVWMALIGALSMSTRAFGTPWGEEVTSTVLLGVVAFLGVELVLRGLWTSSLHRFEGTPHPGARVSTDLFSLKVLCSRFNPSESFFAVLADVFGMDLRGAWALTFLRRSIEPLAIGLVVAGWLSTTFVMIDASEIGLHERFGKLTAEPLDPGLHLVLPWPMSRVERVPLHRVKEIPIGFTGERAGASVLWTVQHADEEYKLLLGDGRDLVTVNASLHYRIKNPFDYAYSVQNPDETLAIQADRVLMQRTVGRSLDGVLSENLAALGTELEREIQRAADDHELGFEIVDLALYGLHPPVRVASAYQAVVAARVDQTTQVLKAEAYRATARPKADGEVTRIGNEARTHRVTRLATARGEATAFRSLEASYLASPELFRLIRFLDKMESQLEGRRINVLDHTIEEDGAAIWLLD
ncbi:MAG: hypothetical protein CL931_17670 [Deltaproteobacteria bacterium]|nr:hypothetical protein [Deltaproteobacteria bacterium]